MGLLDTWHNGAEAAIEHYARALERSARRSVAAIEEDWAAAAVVPLYKEALELRLKAVISNGGHVLIEPVDGISLAKTHSLRWLAQIVASIVKAVRWDGDFRCEGVASIAEFRELVAEIALLDPVPFLIHARLRGGEAVPEALGAANVRRLAGRLDPLLALLERTAAGLAAQNQRPTSARVRSISAFRASRSGR